MTENEQKTINKYVAFILSNDVSVEFLVQMAELTVMERGRRVSRILS